MQKGLFLGEIPIRAFIGQEQLPTRDEQDAYYRRLAQYMTTASDVQEFAREYPDIAKGFGLDKDAITFGHLLGGFSVVKWAAIAGALKRGEANRSTLKEVDDLGTAAEPAQKRLLEAQKALVARTPGSSIQGVVLTVAGVALTTLVAAEIFGLTNLLGFRK